MLRAICMSLNLPQNSVRQIILPIFHRWGTRGSERWGDLSRGTQWMYSGANWTQIFLTPECFYLNGREPKDTVIASKLAPQFLDTHCQEVAFIPPHLNVAGQGLRGRTMESIRHSAQHHPKKIYGSHKYNPHISFYIFSSHIFKK